MNRTAYIAGSISGNPDGSVPNKFDMVTNQLTCMGYNVAKPIAITGGVNPDATARHDIKKILECDEAHMLPDWQESRGAKLERDIALRLGMEVVYH